MMEMTAVQFAAALAEAWERGWQDRDDHCPGGYALSPKDAGCPNRYGVNPCRCHPGTCESVGATGCYFGEVKDERCACGHPTRGHLIDGTCRLCPCVQEALFD